LPVATAGGGCRVAAGLHVLLLEAPVSPVKTAMNQPCAAIGEDDFQIALLASGHAVDGTSDHASSHGDCS
jgi:hypothetical protein